MLDAFLDLTSQFHLVPKINFDSDSYPDEMESIRRDVEWISNSNGIGWKLQSTLLWIRLAIYRYFLFSFVMFDRHSLLLLSFVLDVLVFDL
jgi:hypothetical protein